VARRGQDPRAVTREPGDDDRYNQTARPFNWKFTADDLADLLARISARQQADLVQAA
jgi:hypothetical protein